MMWSIFWGKYAFTNEYEEASLAAFKLLVSVVEEFDADTQFALVSNCRTSIPQGQESLDPPLFIVNKTEFFLYIEKGLFQEANKPHFLLGPKHEVVKRMDEARFIFPSDLEKTKTGTIKVKAKYDWCMQHPDIAAPVAYPEFLVVQPTAIMQSGGDLLYEYLSRKFCDTIIKMSGKQAQCPSGAKITNWDTMTYDYPDDIVTEMLNQYGYNRCKNYTEPRVVHTKRVGSIRFEFSIDT